MKFCIRLDDACPQMNLEKWNRAAQYFHPAKELIKRHGVQS